MKKDSAKELRQLSEEALEKELTGACETLFKMRFQKVVEDMKDKSVIRKMKKKIARIKTILRERKLEQKEG